MPSHTKKERAKKGKSIGDKINFPRSPGKSMLTKRKKKSKKGK